MHRVWLGVDAGVLVRKLTRHHVARVSREGILMWIRAKLPVHALVSGLESIRAFRSGPPASPPASRHPAGLPRLVSFSRSGCPHPARASTASTHPSISLGFAQNCCLGRCRERLSAASSACHARPLEACGACFRLDSFAMESIESGEWTWHDAGVCA